MGIEEVFDAGDSPYTVESDDSRSPPEVARQLIGEFFGKEMDKNRNKIIWVFYQKKLGPLKIKISDGLESPDGERFSVSRSYNRHNRFGFSRHIKNVSLADYLKNTDCLYLQFCGPEGWNAFGLEKTVQGTALGRYFPPHLS